MTPPQIVRLGRAALALYLAPLVYAGVTATGTGQHDPAAPAAASLLAVYLLVLGAGALLLRRAGRRGRAAAWASTALVALPLALVVAANAVRLAYVGAHAARGRAAEGPRAAAAPARR